MLFLELNITLLQDLCSTHLSKIVTEGSDDLSVNINHKLFNAFYSTLNLQKDINSNPMHNIVFIFVSYQLNQYQISQICIYVKGIQVE